MSIARTLLKSFCLLVTVVLGSYVALNLGAVAIGLGKRHQLAGEVTAILARVLPSAERTQDELVSDAGRTPDRHWIEQSCDFRTDDSGWIAYSYRETCVLRSVTAWRVGSEAEARGLVSLRGEPYPPYDGCMPLGTAGETGVVEGPEATYVDPAASDGEPWCTRDLGTSREARALAGERSPLGEGRWLLLMAEQPLVDEPIGCARWSVVFCDNPWFDHAFGDAPEE